MTVALDSKVSIPADVLFHELNGESVLLNLQNGKYYGLNEVGTRMWMLLTENRDLTSTYKALLVEYNVDEEKLRCDIVLLIEQLMREGLVKIVTNTHEFET